MHQTLWLFAVVDYAPNSCFAWRERGPRRAPAKFKSTIRSTTNPSLGYSGLCPRTERPLVTKTMQLDFLRSLPENARLRQATHVAELRKRTFEADGKLDAQRILPPRERFGPMIQGGPKSLGYRARTRQQTQSI